MHTTSLPRRRRGTTPRNPFPTAARSLAVAAVVSTLALLSACGDDGDSSADSSADSAYCSALSDAKVHFTAVQEGDVSTFDEAFAGFHELAAKSPDDLAEDWKAFDGALLKLEGALAKIGLDVSDLETVTAGQVPEGVDAADLAKVPDLMLDLVSDGFTTAATNIERHAIEECDIELAV